MAHDLSEEREADMLEDISTTARETASREFVCEETPIRPDDAVLSVAVAPGSRRRRSPGASARTDESTAST